MAVSILLSRNYTLPQTAPAIERGYNCLTFEGPGQGGVIRKQKIPFRPDWEKVDTPVVDYALTNRAKEIDPNRIALMGISITGYSLPRATRVRAPYICMYTI